MTYHQLDDEAALPEKPSFGQRLSRVFSRPQEADHSYLLSDHPSSSLKSLDSLATWVVPDNPTDRHSLVHGGDFQDGKHHRDQSIDPLARLLPVLIVPRRLEDYASLDQQREWIEESLKPAEWVCLLYDLVIVAVLMVFSYFHQISSRSAAARFFSFFVLMWWTWCAQVLYDIRFEAGDLFHRLCKLLQILFFVFLGGAATNWDVINLRVIPQDTEEGRDHSVAASHSFKLVVCWYAALRIVLACQYAVMFFLAWRSNRPNASISLQLAGTILSIGMLVGAALLDADTRFFGIVKVSLLYLTVVIEITSEVVAAFLKSQIPAPPSSVSMRFSTLTMIVIGEGFVGVLKALAKAIGRFSSASSSIYLSVFFAVLSIFLIWSLLFTGFDHYQWMGRRRTFLWILLHFPMHFLLLLFMAGESNALIVGAFGDAIQSRVADFVGAMNHAMAGSFDRSSEEMFVLSHEMSLVKMKPSFLEEMKVLSPNSSLYKTDDARAIAGFQYLSKFVYQAAYDYGLDVDRDAYKLKETILAMSSKPISNSSASRTRHGRSTVDEKLTSSRADVEELFEKLVSHILEEGYESATWLLPSSGGLLVVIALTHVARSAISGAPLRLVEGLMFFFGVGLSFLGFLNLGNKTYRLKLSDDGKLSPVGTLPIITTLVRTHWALPLLAGALALLYLTILIILSWARSRVRSRSRRSSPVSKQDLFH